MMLRISLARHGLSALIAWAILPLGSFAANPAKSSKSASPAPIAIAEIKRTEPVAFEKEVLPVLSKKCLSCHNATTHESHLVLESPALILKGGDSGPAVVPGDPAKSELLIAASQRGDSPMPPPDNDVGAVPLTSEELGLIKLWIAQGASGAVGGSAAVHWQALPPGVNPIYAVAMTEDGQWGACGRANQIFIYHLPSGRLAARLTDPALADAAHKPGVAHLEMVHSLAFNPDGSLLASGGFREIKFWRRSGEAPRYTIGPQAEPITALAASGDGHRIAAGHPSGAIDVFEAETGKPIATWIDKTNPGEPAPVTALEFSHTSAQLASAAGKTLRMWNVADGAVARRVELPAPAQTLAIMSDDVRIAAAGAEKTIHVWTVAGDEVVAIDSAPGAVTALAAAPSDADRLYSGHADKTIRFWSISGKKQLRQADHGAPITALAVRGDGAQLASAGADNAVKLWKTENGQPWMNPANKPLAPLVDNFAASEEVERRDRQAASLAARASDAKQAVADAESSIKSSAEAIKSTEKARDTAAHIKTEKAKSAQEPIEKKAAADKAIETAAAEKTAIDARLAEAIKAADADAQNQELAKARDELKKQVEAAANKLKDAENMARALAPAAATAQQELLSAEATSAAAEQNAVAAVAAQRKAIDDLPLAQAALAEADKAKLEGEARLKSAKEAMEKARQPIRSLAYSADQQTLAAGGDNGVVALWDSPSGMAIGARTSARAACGPSLSPRICFWRRRNTRSRRGTKVSIGSSNARSARPKTTPSLSIACSRSDSVPRVRSWPRAAAIRAAAASSRFGTWPTARSFARSRPRIATRSSPSSSHPMASSWRRPAPIA